MRKIKENLRSIGNQNLETEVRLLHQRESKKLADDQGLRAMEKLI